VRLDDDIRVDDAAGVGAITVASEEEPLRFVVSSSDR